MMMKVMTSKLFRILFLICYLSLFPDTGNTAEEKTEYISPSALNYFIIGKIYEYQQDYSNALNNYKQGIVFDPFSSLLRNNIAILLLQKNDIPNAIKQLTSAIEINKNDYDSMLLLSTILFSKGDIEGAKKLLFEAKAIDPKRIDAYLKLSDISLFTRDEKSALDILNELLKNSKDKSEAYLRIGKIYLNRRNIKMAAEAFINALTIDPANHDAALMLSITYELEERYDNAIDILKKSQRYVSDDIEVMLLIGKLYLRKEDFNSAKMFFEYAVRNSSNIVLISTTVANIYSQEGYYYEADKIFKNLIAEYNNNEELKYYYGKLLITMKRYDEGIEILSQIKDAKFLNHSQSLICAAYLERKKYEQAYDCTLKNDSENESIFFIKAESLIGMKRYEDARKLLENAVRKREIWCDAIIYLSRVYEKIISKEAAISLLKEATEKYDILLDEKIRILYEIGMIFERNSKINDAIEIMKLILKLNPENPEALNFIGYTYIDNNINLEQAKDMILKAYMYSSRSGAIIDSVGWMYYKLQDYNAALRYLKKAYRLIPEEPIIADHLADTYLKLNYYKEAMEIYENIMQMKDIDERLRDIVRQKINSITKNLPSKSNK